MNRLLLLAITAFACSAATLQASEPNDRPNVLVLLADDMGYSDAGCYGGEIRTPNLDALADDGLRFTQHYSCGRCWPSRATLLAGYYAQQIRRDQAQGVKMGNRPDWAPLLPKRIAPLGYHCYHSGKWHIDGSPTDGGFERSWGGERVGCDWDRFFASKPWREDELRSPEPTGDEGYYSTIAIADHAIACLRLHERRHADEPFFQYVAFYSPHFPLHALKQDIAAYEGAYAEGWDVARKRRIERMHAMGLLDCKLSEREEEIVPGWNLKPEQLQEHIGPGEASHAVAWDTLTDEQKRFQAQKMAIHAAMITRMDAEIGRIVQQLKDMNAYKNTLILFASDNGASAEQIIRGDMHDKNASPGSAASYLCLGPGWATAANTPFRFHKHWNHEGGIASPLIVHWPQGIAAKGELRHAPTHLIDFAPTILSLAGAKRDNTSVGQETPVMPGRSLLPLFDADQSNADRVLWWCHRGNQAIRIGDWKLSMRGGQPWELYDLQADRSETNDLSAEHPEKVQQLDAQWRAILNGFVEDLTAKAAK